MALVGLFTAPRVAVEPIAAHLLSMGPEQAARLFGAGSMPPRPEIAVALAAETAAVEVQTQNILPWPLFRTTGTFEAEHAEIDRALAECTAQLAAKLSPDAEHIVAAAEATRPATHILAAQLAVVARLNQPRSRAVANGAAIKAVATKAAAAKGLKAKNGARKAPAQLTAHTGNSQTIHTDHARPLAEVIDLAAVKVLRRAEKARRAA
jgi:hypothetical protein